MERHSGPYSCDPGPDADGSPDVVDANQPPPDQPSLWCHWEPSEDGREIVWNGAEKFAAAEKWMAYLSRVFLSPNALLRQELSERVADRHYPYEFDRFSFDHSLDGLIEVEGEDDQSYQIEVSAGDVTVIEYDERFPVVDTSRPYVQPTRPPLRALLMAGPDDGKLVEVPRTAIQEGIPASSGGWYRRIPGRGMVATFQFEE